MMGKRKSTLGHMVDSFTTQIDRQTALMDKCAKRGFHRWQPTGRTPCGRRIRDVVTNDGREFDDGVTCMACKAAKTRVSLWIDEPNSTR